MKVERDSGCLATVCNQKKKRGKGEGEGVSEHMQLIRRVQNKERGRRKIEETGGTE